MCPEGLEALPAFAGSGPLLVKARIHASPRRIRQRQPRRVRARAGCRLSTLRREPRRAPSFPDVGDHAGPRSWAAAARGGGHRCPPTHASFGSSRSWSPGLAALSIRLPCLSTGHRVPLRHLRCAPRGWVSECRRAITGPLASRPCFGEAIGSPSGRWRADLGGRRVRVRVGRSDAELAPLVGAPGPDAAVALRAPSCSSRRRRPRSSQCRPRPPWARRCPSCPRYRAGRHRSSPTPTVCRPS